MYLVTNDPKVGLPHSEIPGSQPVIGFPGLFADYHVLLRLLSPRHPPCALIHLIIQPQVISFLRLCCSLILSTCLFQIANPLLSKKFALSKLIEENISNNVLFFSATQFKLI